MTDRILNIQQSFIHRAAEDPDFCQALALCLIIKSEYVSSVYKDYSLRKLQSHYHIGFTCLQKAINNGKKFGLLSVVERQGRDGQLHKDLYAARMYQEGSLTARFHVHNADFGPQIYFQSKVKDNKTKYENAKSRQSLNDVMDLIWLVTISNKITGYSMQYDRINSHFSGSTNRVIELATMHTYEKSVILPGNDMHNYLHTGISYEKMTSLFYGHLSLYHVRKLVLLGIEDGLFKATKNTICTNFKLNVDHCAEQASVALPASSDRQSLMMYVRACGRELLSKQREDWIERKRDNQIKNDWSSRLYHGKMLNKDNFYIRMANSYFPCNGITGSVLFKSDYKPYLSVK